MSPRLWTDQRSFPLCPVFGSLPQAPTAVHLGLLAILVGATLVLLASKVRAHAVAVITAVALVALDLDRLQPWFFEYALLLGVFGLFRRDKLDAESAWRLAAFIVAAIYFWSGAHKLSTGFATTIFPHLIQRFTAYIGDGSHGPTAWLKVAAPWAEASIGVALMIPRLRRWGLVGALGMHALILVAIGPLGNDDNTVIWPWNLAMPALCVALFFRNDAPVFPALLSKSRWAGSLVVFLCGVLPALNIFDAWDSYLSASLYTGRHWDAAIRLSPEAARAMPPDVMAYAMKVQGGYTLHLSAWCMAELNVPIYPEPRVFKTIARTLDARAGHPPGLRLLGEAPPGWFSTERPIVELQY